MLLKWHEDFFRKEIKNMKGKTPKSEIKTMKKKCLCDSLMHERFPNGNNNTTNLHNNDNQHNIKVIIVDLKKSF